MTCEVFLHQPGGWFLVKLLLTTIFTIATLLLCFAGILWQDSTRRIRERSDSSVRKVRHHLGPAPDDGPHDRPQQGLRLRHIHHQRRGSRSCQTGKQNSFCCQISIITNSHTLKETRVLKSCHGILMESCYVFIDSI